MKNKIYYVYVDSDNGVVELFDTFEKADKLLKEDWGCEPEWIEDEDGFYDEMTQYVHVYKRKIK